MNKTIMPADSYNVVNKTILNDTDRFVLTTLYQPLIGSTALSLYFTLWSDLDCTNVMSPTLTHRHLMNVMGLKIEEIVEARKKLEAIGLLKTSVNTDKNTYVYQLYTALNPNEFLTHPFLSILLYNSIGSKDYDRIVQYYKMPNIDLNDYKDITVSFSDVFKTGTVFLKEIEGDLRKRESSDIELKSDLDLNLIISSLPKDIIHAKAFDKATCKILNSISYLYNIDSTHMISLVRNSINEKGLIDKDKLQNNAKSYYKFENNNEVPHLIYNSEASSKVDISKLDNSKRSKTIYTFQTLSPYDFLRGKYNGSNPTTRDVKLVESLLVDLELSPGVINVLIDYVLRINDNKLSKNFVETIAGQWKRLNIQTVEEAMKRAEKEYKGYQQQKTYTPSTKKVETKVPEWFGKNNDEEQVSDEEQAKLDAILSKYS